MGNLNQLLFVSFIDPMSGETRMVGRNLSQSQWAVKLNCTVRNHARARFVISWLASSLGCWNLATQSVGLVTWGFGQCSREHGETERRCLGHLRFLISVTESPA